MSEPELGLGEVRVGDRLALKQGPVDRVVDVRGLSVNRGPADLTFGGRRVLLTAGFPALSPMMGLTHLI